ncbi:TPA: phage major capsid protein [Clostridium perfringens]|uniref:phage major capsid protein n=1 Tax=Clostridium perfringens TaxID=1502 RepID=UPI00016BD93D|nr:phage major capsid protein [Clostridium perfringens]EDT26040.1 phage major capsid protein, HK97 family [Clostridium perfringens CPE str. F4969]MDH5093829.1 Phage capsid family protein [Clostridium perfringens]MDK0670419.1 phage major capsid protein [Clostridium perfringens]MDK0982293.1 phage major capsid protein [Clostridium perfringens]MDM0454161.1 phage major capsid protein [Clostridium perfringens]
MIKRRLELRTIVEKGLEERRNDLIADMEAIVNKADEETRALSTEEVKKYNDLKKEIEEIDETLKIKEEARTLVNRKSKEGKDKEKKEERTLEEIQEEELRTALNAGTTNKGGLVVGETLSKDIIKVLKDRSAVYSFFDATNVKGKYKILKKSADGTASWVAEGKVPDSTQKSTTPTLESIILEQHRLYRESAITQQMLNSEEVNLTAFLKEDIADSMIDAIEAAIFKGNGSNQPTGIISGITKKHNLESRGVIGVDDLKKCKAKIKKSGLKNAKWFMHADTLLVIDLLKDTNGRPLLQPDLTKESDYTLLGLPVECSDALATLDTSSENCVIILANKSAYHTNTQKQVVINTYDDSAYKRAGLIGYGSDIYMDGKTKNPDLVAGIFNPGE